ncbi:MAG: hypothetical protein Q9202_007318 [Teloschistes flavicans]
MSHKALQRVSLQNSKAVVVPIRTTPSLPVPGASDPLQPRKRRLSMEVDLDYNPDGPEQPDEEDAAKSSSVTTSKFSEETKKKIRLASSGDDCWHCGYGGLDVAHIIPQRLNKDDFPRLQSIGILNLDRLGDANNGVPLCPNCHVRYDASVPCWIFYPEDLQFFIDSENEDKKRREVAWTQNRTTVVRKPPDAEAYRQYQQDKKTLLPNARWGSYRVFIVKEFNSSGTLFQEGPNPALKTWHGDPMAALYHAFFAVMDLKAKLPKALRDLQRLYADNDQELDHLRDAAATAPGRFNDGDNNNPDAHKGGSKDDDDDSQESNNEDSDDDDDKDNNNNTAAKGAKTRASETQNQLSTNYYDAYHSDPSSLRRSHRLEKQRPEYRERLKRQDLIPRNELLLMLSLKSQKPQPVMQENFNRGIPYSKRRKVEDDKEDWDPGSEITAQDRIDIHKFFNGGGYQCPWKLQRLQQKTEHGLPSPKTSNETSPSNTGVTAKVQQDSRDDMLVIKDV